MTEWLGLEGTPELDRVLQMWSHQGRVWGERITSHELLATLSDASQEPIVLPGHKDTEPPRTFPNMKINTEKP